MRQTLLLLTLSVLISSCSVYQRVRSNKIFTKAQVVEQEFYQEIPFTLLFDLPVFSVRIGQDTTAHQFIFDTGGFTVFSQELMEQLAETPSKSYIEIKDANNQTSRVYTYMLDELQVGDIAFRNVGFTQISFTESPMFQCLGVSGTLGPNIMKECLWFFDNDRQKIILTDQINRIPGLEAAQRVPLYTDNIYKPWLDFTIDGKTDRATFDTGFNGFFHISSAFRYQLPKDLPFIRQSDTNRQAGHSLVQEDLIRTRVEAITIGPLVLPRAIVDSRASHHSNLLGSEIFRQYNVLFDLAGKAVYFAERDTSSPQPEVFRSFGFSFEYSDSRIRIGSIYQDSPADLAGLETGDIVLRINGQSFLFTDYCDFIHHFDLPDQDTIVLKIMREGLEKEVQLEKAVLF